LRNLQAQDLGFDRQHVLLVSTAPVQTGRQGPALADFGQAVRERLAALPGVLSASLSVAGMLNGSDGGNPSEALRVEGQAPKPGLGLGRVAVAPGFFETVGTALVAGRDFTERDTDTAPPVAIISERMARFFFGHENPLGKRFGWPGETGYTTEIIGVVKDARHGTPRDQRGLYYVPYRQQQRLLGAMWVVVVRTAGNPSGITARVRQELRELDPNLPVLRINTIAEQSNDLLVQERLLATLASAFGVLAMLLVCLGLYGVISYAVARRTNELGIRLALGATPAAVLRLVLKENLWLVLVGIALGVSVALAAARLISARLFGISPTDPLTIVAAIALLLAVAALAAFFPARRVARVDPLVALRHE